MIVGDHMCFNIEINFTSSGLDSAVCSNILDETLDSEIAFIVWVNTDSWSGNKSVNNVIRSNIVDNLSRSLVWF